MFHLQSTHSLGKSIHLATPSRRHSSIMPTIIYIHFLLERTPHLTFRLLFCFFVLSSLSRKGAFSDWRHLGIYWMKCSKFLASVHWFHDVLLFTTTHLLILSEYLTLIRKRISSLKYVRNSNTFKYLCYHLDA